MNYFRRIIHKTIGSVQPSVSPAVIPESMNESPVALASGKQAAPPIPAGKNIAPASETLVPYAASDPIKNSKALSHVLPAADEAETVVESGVLPKESQVLPSQANLLPSDDPLEKSTRIQPSPIEPPSKEQESLRVKNSDDADDAKPMMGVAEKRVIKQIGLDEESAALMKTNEDSSEPSLLYEPQLIGGKDKANDKSDVEPWLHLDSIAPKQGTTLLTGKKADLLQENRQDAHPTLLPAAPGRTRYSGTANQSDETVVMINIGRIEVKAEMPAKPALRYKFSPALSLADYLKQRSEGKIG